MTRIAHVIYLHGFASSPASSKATRFHRELERHGVRFSCPDFNEPSFETLTITRRLEQTRAALGHAGTAAPIALVGSSLGGFVALHAAAMDRARQIDRLILLAPALEFGGNRLRQLGEHGIDEWRRSGRIRVFHYAREVEQDIGFGLYEDAARYDAIGLDVQMPMLVYQGRYDDSVSPALAEQWARGKPNVELHLVDDDHQLTASMDQIWLRSAAFLGLPSGIQSESLAPT
jgi:pimeloyl-ACP methyl ester carboxylesterase